MVEKEDDSIVDGLGLENVVVVEDESEVVLNRIDFIDQCRQDRLDRWRLRRTQHGQSALANTRPHGLQCGDEVGPEESGVIVALIKRDPCCGPFAGRGRCQPFGQQRSLAETRWRGYESQLALGPLAEAFDQSRVRYQTGTPPGDVELGLK